MQKRRLLTGTAALALSFSLFACNSTSKTSESDHKKKATTREVIDTGTGYITAQPLSTEMNKKYSYTKEHYTRYAGSYNSRPNQSVQEPAPAQEGNSSRTTVPSPTVPAAPTKPNPTVNTSDSTLLEVVQLVNVERRKAGLKELNMDNSLAKVAGTKAIDMDRKGYFSHTSPTYGSPFDMMRKFGITYRAAGENIAKGQRSAKIVMNAWMNSPGHRANILNPTYTHIGVGHTNGQNCWVQMFIGK